MEIIFDFREIKNEIKMIAGNIKAIEDVRDELAVELHSEKINEIYDHLTTARNLLFEVLQEKDVFK